MVDAQGGLRKSGCPGTSGPESGDGRRPGWVWIPLLVLGVAATVVAGIVLFWVAGIILHLVAFAVKLAIVVALIALGWRAVGRRGARRR